MYSRLQTFSSLHPPVGGDLTTTQRNYNDVRARLKRRCNSVLTRLYMLLSVTEKRVHFLERRSCANSDFFVFFSFLKVRREMEGQTP